MCEWNACAFDNKFPSLSLWHSNYDDSPIETFHMQFLVNRIYFQYFRSNIIIRILNKLSHQPHKIQNKQKFAIEKKDIDFFSTFISSKWMWEKRNDEKRNRRKTNKNVFTYAYDIAAQQRQLGKSHRKSKNTKTIEWKNIVPMITKHKEFFMFLPLRKSGSETDVIRTV